MVRFSISILAAALASVAAAPTPLVIGVDNSFRLTGDGSEPVSQIIEKSGASYISVHFASLDLPKGAAVTVTSMDGSKKVELKGKQSNVFSEAILGDRVVVTYTAPSYAKASGNVFVLDKFMSGNNAPQQQLESICGQDDSKPSVCYVKTESTEFATTNSVARLLVGGRQLCTGWLVGSEGHLMTNWHCIKDANDAKNVQVEFNARCNSCEDPLNKKQLKCEGDKVATNAEFIVSDQKNDFALVKLNVKAGADLSKYGYLKVRASGPVDGENIYIPQHPNGNPQHMAMVNDDGSKGKITSLQGGSCYTEITDKDFLGHQLDTQGGSSGSPIISTKDNAVVGLHNCGGCNNGGIKINRVVEFLKSKNIPMPKDSVLGSADPTTTPAPTSGTPAPTSGTPAPTSGTPAPTTGTPAPTSGTPAPTTATPAPTSGTPAPTSGTPAPTSGTPAPTTGTPAPSTNTPTTAAPIDGRTVKLCTIANKVVSEYFKGLYQDSSKDNLNEKFVYDESTHQLQAQSNQECLDAYWSGGQLKLHTWACDAKNKNQQWSVANGQVAHRNHDVCLTSLPGSNDIGLAACSDRDIRQKFSTSCSGKDVRNFLHIKTKAGKYLSEWNGGLYANALQSNSNELFEWDASSQLLKAASNGECLDVYKNDQGQAILHTYACSASNANQKWVVGNGKIKHATHNNLCLDFDPTDRHHRAQVWECFDYNDNQAFEAVPF